MRYGRTAAVRAILAILMKLSPHERAAAIGAAATLGAALIGVLGTVVVPKGNSDTSRDTPTPPPAATATPTNVDKRHSSDDSSQPKPKPKRINGLTIRQLAANERGLRSFAYRRAYLDAVGTCSARRSRMPKRAIARVRCVVDGRSVVFTDFRTNGDADGHLRTRLAVTRDAPSGSASCADTAWWWFGSPSNRLGDARLRRAGSRWVMVWTYTQGTRRSDHVVAEVTPLRSAESACKILFWD